MLLSKGIHREMAEARGTSYRIPMIIAALVMSLVFVLTMSPKSNAPVSNALHRQEKTVVPDAQALSQEPLKKYLKNDCPRVRRDWHDLTPEERNLYFDAFWELYKRGYNSLFFDAHSKGAAHLNPNFLPWHRVFTYEFEGRIRALGGRFRCFALPYWDWSRMAGKPVASNPIWKQGFGGDGGLPPADKAYYNATGKLLKHSSLKIPGGCVMDGRFGKPTGYRTTVGDCLRRLFRPGNFYYQSTEQTLYLIEQDLTYKEFQEEFKMWHAPTHAAIGDGSLASQEPLFFLIHSYVDLVWSMRSDCHGYDGMTNWRTNERIYVPSLLDSTLRFPFIDKLPWSIAYYVRVTPALVFNWPQFDIQYDFSDMWQRTKMQMSSCRFSYFKPKPPAKLPSGKTRVSDHSLAMSGCHEAFAQCRRYYLGAMKGCKNMKKSEITLDKIVSPSGISGAVCVQRLRTEIRKIMKRTGKNILALCDGEYDPVCPEWDE